MNEFHYLKVFIPSGAETTVKLDTVNIDTVVSAHVSASGPGKFVLYRNEEVVATLFTTNKNLQAEHKIPVPMRYGVDEFKVVFKNMESQPMTLYASVQTYTEPRLNLKEES